MFEHFPGVVALASKGLGNPLQKYSFILSWEFNRDLILDSSTRIIHIKCYPEILLLTIGVPVIGAHRIPHNLTQRTGQPWPGQNGQSLVLLCQQ